MGNALGGKRGGFWGSRSALHPEVSDPSASLCFPSPCSCITKHESRCPRKCLPCPWFSFPWSSLISNTLPSTPRKQAPSAARPPPTHQAAGTGVSCHSWSQTQLQNPAQSHKPGDHYYLNRVYRKLRALALPAINRRSVSNRHLGVQTLSQTDPGTWKGNKNQCRTTCSGLRFGGRGDSVL